MYEYAGSNYIYRGNNTYGSPVKEIKTVSEAEAKYWDKIEKEIRNLNKK